MPELTEKLKKDENWSRVPDTDLLASHFYLHSFWERIKEGTKIEGWSKEDIVREHRRVVTELLRREMNHNRASDLDDTLPKKITPKKGLIGRVVDAIKGEAEESLDPGDEPEEYYWDYREARRVDWVQDLSAALSFFKGHRVLDIGCGNGAALEILNRSGYETLGIDHNETAIKWCLSRGLNVIHADFLTMPLDKLSDFDLCLGLHFLEHVDDPYFALNRMAEKADRVICVVPLGKRKDGSHKHIFDMEFVHSLGRDFDCGYYAEEIGNNDALIVIDSDLNLEKLRDIPIIAHYLSIVGSYVERDTGQFTEMSDVDILIRQAHRDQNLELAIRRQVPKILHPLLHFIYEPTGPHAKFIPVYDLVARRRTPSVLLATNVWGTEAETTKALSLTPFKTFLPLKSRGGYEDRTFFQTDDLWENYAKDVIDKGLAVEDKYDGFRLAIHSDGNGRVELNTLEERHDLTKVLPRVAEEIKKLSNRPFILDTEMMEVKDGVATPRKDLNHFLTDKPEDDSNIVLQVFELLYEGDTDLHLLPLRQRREKLENFLRKKVGDLNHLRLAKHTRVKTKNEFFAAVDKARRDPLSEGAMVKELDSPYSLSGRTGEWAKLRNFMKVDVQVVKADKKGAGWRYTGGYLDKDGTVREIGNTFVTADHYPESSLIEVNVTHIAENKTSEGETYFTWFLPRVKGPSTKTKPISFESLLRLSKIPEGRYVPKAYCPECLFEEAIEDDVLVSAMNCPHCKSPLVGGDFKKSPLTPDTEELPAESPLIKGIELPPPPVTPPDPDDPDEESFFPPPEDFQSLLGFPWYPTADADKILRTASLDVVDFLEGEIPLAKLSASDREAVIIKSEASERYDQEETVSVPGRKGYFADEPTGRKFVWQHHAVGLDEDEIGLTEEQLRDKGVIASMHGDFRLDWGPDYLEGFTLFSPGSMKKPDKLLTYPKNGARIAGTIKNPQPKEWLNVDNRVFAPGQPGARTKTFGKMWIVDTGTFAPSIQEKGYHEFLFKFKKNPQLNGIWAISSKGTEKLEGLGHMFFKINGDKPYYLRHPQKAEAKKLPDWMKPDASAFLGK